MTDSPDRDQQGALYRDLERLRELVHPYVPGPSAPFVEALPHMPDPERAEARAILDRLDRVNEPPEKTAERQDMLLRLAEAEALVHEALARPHYLVRDGDIVTDPETGQPLPDPDLERRARAELAELDRLRCDLTGLPPAAPGGREPGGA